MNTLQVTTPSERESAMSRTFDAPRALVFEAWTRPELLTQWLGSMPGWTWAVCEVDLRVGGKYRYLWRGPDGAELGMGGEFKEIVPGQRIVATEKYDQAWYPGGAVSTVTLAEQGGKTTLTLTVKYDTKDARDAVLQSPMKSGVESGFNLLEQLLAKLRSRK
jgi:uncharacterized protein YndB with AHSA1/START domain